jgi:hypothetical protein
VLETKLFALLEVARTRAGALLILQSNFFDTLKSFTLSPELIIQSQRTSLADVLTRRIGGIAPCGGPIAPTGYPSADLICPGPQPRKTKSRRNAERAGSP